MSRAEVSEMTYRAAWETYFEPHLKERGELKETAPVATPTSEAALAFQRALADQMCGGRKYEGEMWWVPLINYDDNPGLERPKT